MRRVNTRRAQHAIADANRRGSARYSLALEVRYATSGGDVPAKIGTGISIDLSSSGLSLITDMSLLIGQGLTAYIDWPVLLNDDVKLQLVITGIVVRTNGTKVAIKILRYDFRTRGVKQQPIQEWSAEVPIV
jgi:hypothetical protein